MNDASAETPQQREPLGAPTTYQPIPSNKLFPTWERNLKFARIAALVVVAVVGYRYWKSQQPEPVVPVVRFAPVSQWTSGSGLTLTPAISRSGKLAAFASDREGAGNLAIWVQPFPSGKPARLTAGAFHESDPDISPDDRQIAFRSEMDGGGIYLASTAGSGPPQLVAKDGWRPRFSPDGKWIAYFRLLGSDDVSAAFGFGQIFIVPSAGGESRRIQPGFPNARYPIWTPNGRLLFVGARADGARDWWITGIDGGDAVQTHAVDRLTKAMKSSGPPEQWLGEKVIFAGVEEARSHVWEIPISVSTGQASGAPRRLTDGGAIEQHSAIAPDSRMLFASLTRGVEAYSLPIEPDEARVTGKLAALTNYGGRVQLPSITADGSKIAYVSDRSGMPDLWVSDANGKSEEAVTTFRTIGYRPVISPDGKHIVYPSSVNGQCTVLVQRAVTGGQPAALNGCFGIWDWSPDGKSLAIFRNSTDMKSVDLMAIESGKREPVLSHKARNIYGARFSPDGRWLAFAAGLTGGQAQIFIAPLRGAAAGESQWILVGSDHGGEPAWSPNGAVLYFRSKRDGYHCIWAHRLGPDKKPVSEPISVQHFHSAAFGLYSLRPAEFHLAVGKDRLVLNASNDSGNLWTMSNEP